MRWCCYVYGSGGWTAGEAGQGHGAGWRVAGLPNLESKVWKAERGGRHDAYAERAGVEGFAVRKALLRVCLEGGRAQAHDL